MKIPISYVFRNLWTRKLTTLLTAGGMALVVFVFAAVLMLDAGLRKTLVSTGSYENAVLLRPAAQTEIQSAVYREQASLLETLPEVARGEDGTPLVSKETVVLIAIPKRGSDKPANLVVRGLPAMGIRLRPQVAVTDGRMFRPGSSEIVVGRAIAEGFDGTGIGETLRFAGREWTVVGTFDGGKSGFDSEIWGDVDQMLAGLPALGLFLGARAAGGRGPVRGVQGAGRGRPAPHPRGAAGAALLPGPVEVALHLHQLPGRGALRHLLDRCDDRGHDHDVRGRGQPHRRDRHAARAGLPALEHPRRVPPGVAAAVAGGRRPGPRASPRSCRPSPSPR